MNRTIFFWAPLAKWGLVAAGVKDLGRPAEKLSTSQNIALAATGFIWVSPWSHPILSFIHLGEASEGWGKRRQRLEIREWRDLFAFGQDEAGSMWPDVYGPETSRDQHLRTTSASIQLRPTKTRLTPGPIFTSHHPGQLLSRRRQLLRRIYRCRSAVPNLGLQAKQPNRRQDQ